MKTTKYLHIVGLMLLACIVACQDAEQIQQQEIRTQKVVAIISDNTATRVGMNFSEDRQHLIARWQEGDNIHVFILPESGGRIDIGEVPVRGISDDGKSCHFFYNLPDNFIVRPTTNYRLVCISGAKSGIELGSDIFYNGSLKRMPLADFKAPIISDVSASYVQTMAEFRHYGVYELLHVTNKTDNVITFSQNGYSSDAPSWYKLSGALRVSNGHFLASMENAEEPIEVSAPISIKPGETGVVVSWYIPNGNKITNAQLVASINNQTVYSVNRKSSDVELQTGNAYNLYVTWDGTNLKFGKEEITEEKLTLSTNSLELKVGKYGYVDIISGSGQYSVTNNNPEIVELSVSNLRYTFKAIKTGTATITFKDEKYDITETLTIKVDDSNHTIYPISSYTLSEDGKTLISWHGDEKIIDLGADPAFDKVTTIGEWAFAYESKELETLKIPATITTIAYSESDPNEYCGLFYNHRLSPKLKEVIIDESNPNYSSDGSVIFNKDKTILYEGIPTLTVYNIPETVRTIGSGAFAFNEEIINIKLPSNLEVISDIAFAFCYKLQNMQFPSSLRVIGKDAFNECVAITDINLPNSVEVIDEGAFKRCHITSFKFPPKVTKISDQVFEFCFMLESVTLPDKITEIGIESFDGCRALKSIEIPETVKAIGYMAFYNCQSLTSVIIPQNVETIDRYGFAYCTSLKTVYALPTTPPTLKEDTFEGNPLAQSVLYVYPESKSKYVQASGWKDFGIIKAIDE